MIKFEPYKTLSPKQLYEMASKHKFPRYRYNSAKDPKLKELEELKCRYLKSLSLKDKVELLMKEREIIYEELQHPELTLVRNYQAIEGIAEIQRINLEQIIRTFNISGLQRIEGAFHSIFSKALDINKYKETISQEKIISILKNAQEASTNDPNYNFLRECIDNIYGYINSINPFPDNLARQIKQVKPEKNPNINKFLSLYNTFINASFSNNKTIKKVQNLLRADNLNLPTKQLVILAAGKFKSNENFEILKKFATNKNEKSPVTREFAIQSIALYVKKKPDEVRDILETIKRENSDFSPLATILMDKINGNYHNTVDRELKYNFFNHKDVKSLRSKIDKIVIIDTPVNRKQSNRIDMEVIPYANIFDTPKIVITEDTYTKYMPESVGQRKVYKYQFPNIGFFNDCLDGVSTRSKAVVNKININGDDELNTITHELGHSFNFVFEDSRLQRKLNMLYKKALKNNLFLDYYAALDPQEYFAQGCEAYSSFYKPHSELFKSFDYGYCYSNTRYKLMEKDPELYQFIQKLFEKYSL